jgi:hypothetical protein
MAALSAAMLMPSPASAQSNMQPQTGAMQSQPMQAQPMQGQTAGQAETMEMVSARVAVTSGVDGGKAKAGDRISTRLAKTVTLKDGKELPAGTKIVGVVAMDDMQMNGKSKLALNFNQAELKDGTMIPIKATIVGVYGAESQDMQGRPLAPGDEMTHTWTGHPDAVDEIGAMPGVDLHSKVTSQNSGVLISTTGRDVKLKSGTEIALAVAPARGM